jgi:hypothetical protein
MKIDDIKIIAKNHDIKVGKMKKTELVRSIQAAEGNFQCFETGQKESCGQLDCLWRADCT